VPPDPDQLLRQADALAGGAGASQADLRRAISTAYYAVFHFSLTAAADMVCGVGDRSAAGYSLVYRSVDHKTLRSLCAQLRAFSSEVGTGSREENASKQEARASVPIQSKRKRL
jgi:hypothetical protein